MGLSQQDLLSTLAEVSAAFVGFSMIVSLFRSSADSKSRVLSVRDVAETSLVIAGAALAPILVFEFGLPEESAWGLPSAVLSIAWLSMTFVALRRFARSGGLGTLPTVPLVWPNIPIDCPPALVVERGKP